MASTPEKSISSSSSSSSSTTTTIPMPSSSPTPTGRTQALKDLKLTIEYKHLKQNAPGGVLVTPAFDDLRRWHGVIFVRRGACEGGVFRFVVRLPRAYNDRDVYPDITFEPPGAVINPFVDPSTGRLDLASGYPLWDPSCHFMITALTFVKKIFYLKDVDLVGYPDDRCFDPLAKRLCLDDKPEFRRRCQELVARSQETVYDDNKGGGGGWSSSSSSSGPLAFSRPQPAHEALRKTLAGLSGGSLTVQSGAQVLEAFKTVQAAAAAESRHGQH